MEGLPLSELFRGREAAIAEMRGRLVALMKAEGLEYGDRTHTYNSRLAQELAVWGDGQGATDALHDALYRAYFVDAVNISDPDALVAVADSVGLDPEEARAVLEERRFSGAIDEHWRSAREMGVTGVPTFVARGYGVVGAQPYETLVTLMERIGVPRRTRGG
jgi:predicted DsbA family dithiol-disulfide isomerase